MAFPTLDELCKGKDLRGRQMEGRKIAVIATNAKALRKVHRFSSGGYTNKKEGALGRFVAQIPYALTVNPESPFRQYYMNGEIDKFLQKYGEFLVDDKVYNRNRSQIYFT